MLRVVDLTVEVGHRLLVAEASFTVAPGDVVGLVGPNGAGKTSLLAGGQRARLLETGPGRHPGRGVGLAAPGVAADHGLDRAGPAALGPRPGPDDATS